MYQMCIQNECMEDLNTEEKKYYQKKEKDDKLDYTLKNNYLFLALMNVNLESLQLLICSLLGYQENEIIFVQIQNPIKLGQSVEDRTFILDVAVLLNNDTFLNIELQVNNYNDWPERSVGYLCRSYDQLNRGEDYINTKPVIHISILDFTLFPDVPEFYASYRLLNLKNHHEYTSKFQLYVLDLKHIELATKEDRDNKRDVWARIFQAETWGDLMAIAEQYKSFEPVVENMDKLMADDRIRLQCDAEERMRNRERAIKAKLARQEAQIVDREAQIADREAQIADKERQLAEQKVLIAELQKKLAAYEE